MRSTIQTRKIFLLSPALMNGVRAKQLQSPSAQFPLAQSFRSAQGVPIAEAFAFMSCLYFRGKITYARHFAASPSSWTDGGVYVIAPGFGLVSPDWRLDPERMRQLQRTRIDPRSAAYRRPLEQYAEALAARLGEVDGGVSVILLGSVGSGKYVDLLWPIFQERLLYPRCFSSMGDMQRGATLLRAARAGEELEYAPVETLLFKHGRRAGEMK